MTVETCRFHEALRHYHEIYFSDYGDNTELLQKLQALGPAVHAGVIDHMPDRPGTGITCHRGESGTVSVVNGRMYPCCVAPGIKGAQSIEVSPTWREDIQDVPFPCDACRFSGRG